MTFKRFLSHIFKRLLFVRNLFLSHAGRDLKILKTLSFDFVLAVCRFSIPSILIFLFGLVIFDIGYQPFYSAQPELFNIHLNFLLLLAVLSVMRYILEFRNPSHIGTRIFNLVLVGLVFYLLDSILEILKLLPVDEGPFVLKKVLLYCGITVLFVFETGHTLRFIYRRGVNTASLFVGSFLLLIVVGGFLLLLPNAAVVRTHPIDAFFTSVSAVCVTGLTVVDTAAHFTMFGKVVILMLIQIGGLGIMTFAGVISYLVLGKVSIQHQIALGNILESNRLADVIGFVSRIVFVTICFELAGAALLYASVDASLFDTPWERVFFSLFHSVSAFCNAGFSTLTNGLYEDPLRFNYSLQWVVAVLIILGGMGFPLVFNIFIFLKIKITNVTSGLFGIGGREVYTNILSLSSKLALVTTAILLIFGFCAYFVFEYNSTLQPHQTLFGKITTSFFGSVTPRTAGFNTVDLTKMTLPTVLVYLLLMWIGASPGSTGGGIKTTVAAVAFLNARSLMLGRTRMEVFRTEISDSSIKRGFALVLLSLIVLGLAVFGLSINDSEKGLLRLSFEAFSAFSTVGLTLGVTPHLSLLGKIVIMAVMFIGRVGALTLLFAIVTKPKPKYYRYPKEEIMF